MVVSDKHEYIFYHVPKNAGTSIKKILKDEFDGKQYGVHTAVRKSYRTIGHDKYNNYYKFAVIRNPYSRVVSWYLHLIRESKHGLKKENILRPKSFEYYIKYQRQIYKHKELKEIGLFQTQFDFLRKDNEIGVDYIIRYEDLQIDFDYICDYLFGKTIKLDHLKKWGDIDYWKYYNNETKRLVEEIFKKDFEYFGYNYG